MRLDPKSLEQLRREVAKIPQQRNPRAEASRKRLVEAVKRMDQENGRK